MSPDAAAGTIWTEGAEPFAACCNLQDWNTIQCAEVCTFRAKILFQNVFLSPMPGNLKRCSPSAQWIGSYTSKWRVNPANIYKQKLTGKHCCLWLLSCITVLVKTLCISVISTQFICLHRYYLQAWFFNGLFQDEHLFVAFFKHADLQRLRTCLTVFTLGIPFIPTTTAVIPLQDQVR